MIRRLVTVVAWIIITLGLVCFVLSMMKETKLCR